MLIARHRAEQRRSLHARAVLVLSVLAALVVGLAGASTAHASTPAATSGRTQVVSITIDVPALVVTNLCNADVVNLHGQETITTATTPEANGAYRVVSTLQARNLTGNRVAPDPPIAYKGDDTQNTYSYEAPPPYPTTVTLLHWTKLVPQAKAPSMWLVLVTREVINADGTTVPTVTGAYLVCSQPPSHNCPSSK